MIGERFVCTRSASSSGRTSDSPGFLVRLSYPPVSTPPTPPAASRATACAPTRCRSRSSASRADLYRGGAAYDVHILRISATVGLAIFPHFNNPASSMLGRLVRNCSNVTMGLKGEAGSVRPRLARGVKGGGAVGHGLLLGCKHVPSSQCA